MPTQTELRYAIDSFLSGPELRAAINRAPELSRRYREERSRHKRPFAASREDALAYALTRMPATYGAVCEALKQTLRTLRTLRALRTPQFSQTDNAFPELKTLLDVGAGTGAASWAARGLLDLENIICLERGRDMADTGKALSQYAPGALKNARWVLADITETALEPLTADIVIAAYTLNEISEPRREEAALKLWRAAREMLLIVEPGTPDCFRQLKDIRLTLQNEGAYIAAPCPLAAGKSPCPLPGNDWCHFSARVERSKAHKQAKNGGAPYEDEKFCYLALLKNPPHEDVYTETGGAYAGARYYARVLRHPIKHKGHIRLSLCADGGISEQTITRGSGEAYSEAKKASWGDAVGFTR